MAEGIAIQDQYPPIHSHCYGCGRLNEQGLRIKSYWNGREAVAEFLPESYHLAYPGFVYGGLIASLVDCHAIATAAAAACEAEGRAIGSHGDTGFVTASLQVEFRSPTPVGQLLELRARAEEIGQRKVVVSVTVRSAGQLRAEARAVAVRMPAGMQPVAGDAG